jgi:hypothetical protein
VVFPRGEELIAILAESHEALLGLSHSEDGAMLTMTVQMLDVLVITEIDLLICGCLAYDVISC